MKTSWKKVQEKDLIAGGMKELNTAVSVLDCRGEKQKKKGQQ